MAPHFYNNKTYTQYSHVFCIRKSLEGYYQWLFPNVGLMEILFSSLIFSASYEFSAGILLLYHIGKQIFPKRNHKSLDGGRTKTHDGFNNGDMSYDLIFWGKKWLTLPTRPEKGKSHLLSTKRKWLSRENFTQGRQAEKASLVLGITNILIDLEERYGWRGIDAAGEIKKVNRGQWHDWQGRLHPWERYTHRLAVLLNLLTQTPSVWSVALLRWKAVSLLPNNQAQEGLC